MVNAKSRIFTADRIFWLFLAAAVLLCYHPAWQGKFVWDDSGHVTKPELRSVSGLLQIWTVPGAAQQYYPLTHTVFWLEHRLWGDLPPGYHLLNISLHLFSVFLLLKILRRLAIPGAWFAVAIFALHPVVVESVAWVSELKNSLSGVFFFGSVLACLEFDSGRKRRFYWAALGLFIAGLLSKTAIAPMPVLLLIVFWWKRGALSLKRDVVPLVPFLLIALAMGLFTAWMERTFIISDAGDEFKFSLAARCLIAGRAFWFYLGKLAWPANLVFIYPRWKIDPQLWQQYLFPAAVILSALILWLLRRKQRAPLAAFLYFGAALGPALGFINAYPFRFSFVADHFQYLASIGPIVFAAAIIVRACGRVHVPYHALLFIPAGLGILTWHQCRIYTDADVLYQSIVAKNPDCWMAWYNLGDLASERGKTDSAVTLIRNTLAIKPDYLPAWVKMGDLLLRRKEPDSAIACYRQALQYDSALVPALLNLGCALSETGSAEESIRILTRATKKAPSLALARFDLGNALIRAGRMEEGTAQLRKAVEFDPSYAAAQVNLGWALGEAGQNDSAIAHLQKALALDPGLNEAHSVLGNLLMKQGKPAEAIPHFRAVLRTRQDDYNAISALRDACLKNGQLDEAIQVVEDARNLAKYGGQDSLAKGIEGDLKKLYALQRSAN